MHLLTLSLIIAMCGPMVQALEQELRDYVLKIHNDYRKNVRGACQMNRMQYDKTLEAQATAWANRCVFAHESISGRGENLAWNSAHDDEKVLMTNAAKNWYDEVKLYSYGQYSCGSACHYTQIVWDKTDKVGCATKRCSYLTNAYSDSWYFVCFYLPGGNMNGEKPYQTSCDSPCREGQTQDADGLCVGSGADTGSDDSQTESQEDTTTTQTQGTTSSLTQGRTSEQPCENKNNRCVEWASRGQCNSNPQYMDVNCALACGHCGDECKDINAKCRQWAEDKQCEKNPSYMLTYCKLSCNEC